MGALKRWFGIVFLLVPVSAGAVPSAPDERALLFADCAGSFAAEAEHLRLLSDPGVERAEDAAILFGQLLDATFPTEDAATAFAVRLRATRAEARLIQRNLLNAASFSTRKAYRAPARHEARRRRTTCEKLLLGS